jgi:hypothetical protein
LRLLVEAAEKVVGVIHAGQISNLESLRILPRIGHQGIRVRVLFMSVALVKRNKRNYPTLPRAFRK